MSREVFQLRIETWDEIHELPGSWPAEALRDVLRLADFDDDVADGEVAEMAVMALQDLEARVAAERVLEVVFGAAMAPGVRQNLVDDLYAERPWEQFARIDQQAGIFEAVVLLHRAFPRSFGIPDAVQVRVGIRATGAEGSAWLRAGPSPALMLRLLASGMDEDAILNRLYEAELAGDRFQDAGSILWRIQAVPAETRQPDPWVVDVTSSCQWLGPLEDREPWQGTAWPDRAG